MMDGSRMPLPIGELARLSDWSPRAANRVTGSLLCCPVHPLTGQQSPFPAGATRNEVERKCCPNGPGGGQSTSEGRRRSGYGPI